jgi:hypothetical protein
MMNSEDSDSTVKGPQRKPWKEGVISYCSIIKKISFHSHSSLEKKRCPNQKV